MPEKGKAQPPPKTVAKTQKERFIETARELGVDESGEAFERMFAKVVPPAKPKAKTA